MSKMNLESVIPQSAKFLIRRNLRVTLLAFGLEPNDRPVEVPAELWEKEDLTVIELLDAVFEAGQNGLEPTGYRSVSVGDMINLGPFKYVVKRVGFEKVKHHEYMAFLTAYEKADYNTHVESGPFRSVKEVVWS